MTPEFWANLAVAIATLLAVLVALFGPWINARLYRPGLTLTLRDPQGELTTLSNGEPARYYHLRASSDKAWPKATEAQILILRIDERKPHGVSQPIWVGALPVRWQYHDALGMQRTIVRDTFADLLRVRRSGILEFRPLWIPINFRSYEGVTNLAITVVAQARECSSEVLKLSVDWDGMWHDGAAEMAQHLVIREQT
jgi:hypothetical protein